MLKSVIKRGSAQNRASLFLLLLVFYLQPVKAGELTFKDGWLSPCEVQKKTGHFKSSQFFLQYFTDKKYISVNNFYRDNLCKEVLYSVRVNGSYESLQSKLRHFDLAKSATVYDFHLAEDFSHKKMCNLQWEIGATQAVTAECPESISFSADWAGYRAEKKFLKIQGIRKLSPAPPGCNCK